PLLCGVCLIHKSMNPLRSETTTLVCRDPPYSDSAESVRPSNRAFRTLGPQPHDNKYRSGVARPTRRGHNATHRQRVDPSTGVGQPGSMQVSSLKCRTLDAAGGI